MRKKMTEKKIKKNNLIIALKVLPMWQTELIAWKTSYSFNDFKWKRMVLSSAKKLSALLVPVNSWFWVQLTINLLSGNSGAS